MHNAAGQYLRKVKQQLLCPNSMKKPFLRQLEAELSFFCADHADADLDLLSQQFGSPGEVAEDFLTELGELAVSRYTRSRRRLLYLTLGVVLSAVIFSVILSIRTSALRQTLPEGEFVASIIYETGDARGAFCPPPQDAVFGG